MTQHMNSPARVRDARRLWDNQLWKKAEMSRKRTRGGEAEDMKIALVGAGSMGTVIGALLSKAGLDVLMVDANREHVDALNSSGATVTGHMQLNVPVKAVTPEEWQGTAEMVIYLVKTTYDDAALPQVLPHLDEGSFLITLQNGVPEEKVASVVGRERTMGGAIGWGATWLRPGVSELTSEPEKMTFDIGELDGSVTPRLQQVKQVLDHCGEATITDNLMGVRWTKLLANVAMSGLGAAIDSTYGGILDDDKATGAALCIILETLLTARALGIRMEPMQGVDPAVMLDVARQGLDTAMKVVRMVWGPHRDQVPSMLQDLRRGLPCEVDSLNGYLSARSEEAGVATPVNDRVTEIIRAVQEGSMPLSFSNLERIEVPDLSFYLEG